MPSSYLALIIRNPYLIFLITNILQSQSINNSLQCIMGPTLGSSAPGLCTPPRGTGEEVCFVGERGPRRSDNAPTATLPQLAILFLRFPCRCPRARKSSAVWTEKRGAYLQAQEGSVHYQLEVGAGPQIFCF